MHKTKRYRKLSKRLHKKKHTKRRYSKANAKGIPIFSAPEKKKNTPILDLNNDSNKNINIIPGLKTYLKYKM
jgi:hypothetical protein